MNDLSRNELLSAYVDGELTAAEQAKVERLLASDPAARQLVDELRALSATLQSLPQEKLGEDLTGAVLQAAGRRMITEGEPEEAAAVPLAREVFQRFLSRRTLGWLAVTAAIAVAIWINEQWQKPKLGPAANRGELARVDETIERKPPLLAEAPKTPATPEPPAAGPAVPSSAAEPSVPAAKPAEGAARQPDKIAPLFDRRLANGKEKALAKDRLDAAGAASEGSKQRLAGTGEQKAGEGPSPPAKEPPVPGHDQAKKAATLPKAKSAPAIASPPAVLVVRCSVTPAAMRQKALDKLLAANGVVAYRQPSDRSPAMVAATPGQQSAEKKSQKDGEYGGSGASPTPEGGVVDRVYVEATPAQLKTVLSGLADQPGDFVAVSAEPVEGRLAESIIGQYAAAGGRAAAGLTRGKAVAGRSKKAAAKPEQGDFFTAPAEKASSPPTAPAGGQQQQVPQRVRRQAAPSPVPQRVLFVLQIGGQQPPAAAKRAADKN
ncbi:MAG: hypothetical protein ABFC96_06290 [Thermoguttaceae bacterium]